MRHILATVSAFVLYSLRRFNVDGCFAASGALSYTTLVSLVPLAVIALGSLSSFPIFAPVRDQILQLVLENFVPSYRFRRPPENAGSLRPNPGAAHEFVQSKRVDRDRRSLTAAGVYGRSTAM